MTAFDEEKLGDLLSVLPPAPDSWVKTAQNLPFERLFEIVERAEADDDYRRHVIEDPAAALEEADVVAHADAIELLRERLEQEDRDQ